MIWTQEPLTRRPLIQDNDFGWVDARALNAIIPYLGNWMALEPHKHHGNCHNEAQSADDDPDDNLRPAAAEPEESRSERELAQGGGEDREEAGKSGNEGHLGHVRWVHVVPVLAVVEGDASRGGTS